MELPAPFGPYLLLRQLGSGGMAEVFQAVARGIGGFEKTLCVKFIRREYANHSAFIEMLIAEAKMVSEIVHPNVAQVFDLGHVDGQYYIAMEFVDGVDAYALMNAAVERGVHLPVPAAALIVRDVAAGLSATHGKSAVTGRSLGIVHRDVSPHNVLVSFEGEVKIIDFGVAKATFNAQQTAVGVIKGKYNYMSPEQARGEVIDHRTDIFSTGIVLWELLAGEPLYKGENIAQMVDQARRARVPGIRRARADVPKEVERILKRALAKNVKRRYQETDDLVADLDTYLARSAGGYTRRDLCDLLSWLFPKRQEVTHRQADGTAESVAPMKRSDYVSIRNISIVSAPGVQQQDALGTEDSTEGWEEMPTIKARNTEEEPSQADLRVPPVPMSGGPFLYRFRWALVALLGVLAVSAVTLLWVARRGGSSHLLEVRSDPPGAQVWVDGRPTGLETPAQLASGIREGDTVLVRLHLAGYEPWEDTVSVHSEPELVQARLRPLGGVLSVRSTPAGADVRVDGRVRGKTPLELRDLDPTRPVTVELMLEGYQSMSRVHYWSGRRGKIEAILDPNK